MIIKISYNSARYPGSLFCLNYCVLINPYDSYILNSLSLHITIPLLLMAKIVPYSFGIYYLPSGKKVTTIFPSTKIPCPCNPEGAGRQGDQRRFQTIMVFFFYHNLIFNLVRVPPPRNARLSWPRASPPRHP